MLKTSRADPAPRLEIAHRPRRNRKADWARRLVAEHVLTTNDLIWPLFLIDGQGWRGSASTRRCARPSGR
jgi:porphobilinogen synthase